MKTVRPYHQSSRAQSAEATANRVVEAFVARLMIDWYDQITLQDVARDAGVTVQTVIRRFTGKEGLLTEAVKVLTAQIDARRKCPGSDLDGLTKNLVADYEESGDAVLRLLALEPRHLDLKPFLDHGRGCHRQWLAQAFRDRLQGQNDALLDALVVCTDVYTWKLLRRDMGHSPAATAEAMGRLLRGTLLEDKEAK